MSRWAKMDSGLDDNPKIFEAGRLGREVFLFFLRRNAALEADGEIPAKNASPEYIARCLGMPVTEARDGVTAAVTAELVEISDGVIRFIGWAEEWRGPKSNAERQAIHRQRKAAKSADSGVPVTNSNDTSVTARDPKREVTDLEERRGEKKRREEKRKDLPPAAAEFAFPEGTAVGAEPAPSSDHPAFIARFTELYAEANAGAKPTWGARPGKVVKELLAAHGLAECVRRAENMFRAPPEWPPKPHDLAALSKHFDLFAQPVKRAGGYVNVTGKETYRDGIVEDF